MGCRFDGGDTSKFLFPGCWSLSNLAWSLLSYPNSFSKVGTAQDLVQDIMWEADFVVKARYAPGSFVAYTSAPGPLGESHMWWGRPEDIRVRRGRR